MAKLIPMKTLKTPPANRNHIRTTLQLFPDLRNSLHLKALFDFLLTARRGDAHKLLVTTLFALLLAIPATALILANGLNNASHNLKQSRRISVFMTPGTTETTATQLSTRLMANNYVADATLAPLPLLESGDIDLPIVIEVIPATNSDSHSIIKLADQLAVLAGVEFVELNTERLDQTAAAFDLTGRFARIANAAALLVAGLLMLAVSYHDIQKSRNNIKLINQLGGTLVDVRRPFLYRESTLGLFAGVLGIATAITFSWAISKYVDTPTYQSLIPAKPTLMQVILFFAMVIAASIAATVRMFSKNFTYYNQ